MGFAGEPKGNPEFAWVPAEKLLASQPSPSLVSAFPCLQDVHFAHEEGSTSSPGIRKRTGASPRREPPTPRELRPGVQEALRKNSLAAARIANGPLAIGTRSDWSLEPCAWSLLLTRIKNGSMAVTSLGHDPPFFEGHGDPSTGQWPSREKAFFGHWLRSAFGGFECMGKTKKTATGDPGVSFLVGRFGSPSKIDRQQIGSLVLTSPRT